MISQDPTLERKYVRLKDRFRVVTDLAMRLATELDVDVLLGLVLTESRRLTASDAGSLYVKEADDLVFKLAQNDSLPDSTRSVKNIHLHIDSTSLVGLAASDKKTLRIDDVQSHASYNRDMAGKLGYDVHTMLVVPMLDHRQEVLGVLQLMNALDTERRPVPYDDDTAYLTEVLASHAATALEVAKLYQRQTQLLDAMVAYTARAIDARDAATAGHSGRVSSYAVKLAEAWGGFSKAELRELKIAGLFHDVGKIGVREAILTKKNKLSQNALNTVKERFEAARLAHGLSGPGANGGGHRAGCHAWLDEALELVTRANVPTPLADADVERLRAVRATSFTDSRGAERPLLTAEELEFLSVQRGNLTASERRVMEAHVTMSFNILKRFPFTPELQRVPDFVAKHHEKWDGSGYPYRLKGDAIPLGARIIAVVDAFDALTARDRPYKNAIPIERSVAILEEEAAQGAWDPAIVATLKRLVLSGELKIGRGTEPDPVAPALG